MKTSIEQLASALLCGALFGFGLSISGMLDPARVQGFLDIFGSFDPSLIFVLGGAVTVAFAGRSLVRHMARPLFEDRFQLPTKSRIDRRLIVGSAIFGIGWGLGGLCPGPALASLTMGYDTIAAFVVAMAAGMILHDRVLPGPLP